MADVAATVEKVTSLLNAGLVIIKIARQAYEEVADAQEVIASNSEETIEAAITELEALLPALRQKAQEKLRGS